MWTNSAVSRTAMALLLSMAACAPRGVQPEPPLGPPPKPLVDPNRRWDLSHALDKQLIESKSRDIEDYALGLQLFISADPKDHEEAFRIVDRYSTLEVVPQVQGAKYETFEALPDRQLIAFARGTDAARAKAAKAELAKRGTIVVNCLVFGKRFDLHRWNAAKAELISMGPAAQINMGFALAGVLLAPDRREDWGHARYFLAELKEIGFEIMRSVFENYLRPSLPGDHVPAFLHQEKVEQVFMTMIQLSGYARRYFLELTKQKGVWHRRIVASSIGKAREVTLLDVLREYTRDDDDTVRATAYDALGNLGIAGKEPGEILVEALGRESSDLALKYLFRSLEQLGPRETVPKLIAIVDHPRFEIAREVMKTLRKLTGARSPQTPAEWQAWWEKNKSRWQ